MDVSKTDAATGQTVKAVTKSDGKKKALGNQFDDNINPANHQKDLARSEFMDLYEYEYDDGYDAYEDAYAGAYDDAYDDAYYDEMAQMAEDYALYEAALVNLNEAKEDLRLVQRLMRKYEK